MPSYTVPALPKESTRRHALAWRASANPRYLNPQIGSRWCAVGTSVPDFSRLAWTNIEPVYLQGADIAALLEEARRIFVASGDATIKAKLEKLSALAMEAQQRSQVSRFFG